MRKAIGDVVNDSCLAAAADDLHPPAHDLAIVADRELPEAPLGRGVEEHVGATAQVADVAGFDVPGHPPAREVLEPVDQHALLGAVGQREVQELNEQVVGALDAGHRAHALDEPLRETVCEVDVRGVARGHPEVGLDVIDGDRGVVEDPQEKTDLDEDEGHGEGDAGDRHRRAQLVVQEVLEREVRHRSGLRSLAALGSGRRGRGN